MASLLSFPYRLVFGAIFLASIFHQVPALTAEYCSSFNTAQNGANSSIYQSNGLCYGFCLEDYAFAILQNQTCWCSNDAPGSTTSTSDCSFQCPGYPNDLCGDPAEGLYGYFSLTKSPTATVGGSGNAASSTGSDQVTVTATPSATTALHTSTKTPSPSTSDTSASPTSETTSSTPTPATTSDSSTSQSSTSASSKSTWTPTPVTSLETVTGQIRTVTVTPTAPLNSQTLGVAKKGGGSGLSTGAAVGLTVGLVALVALVCSILYFCWRKRQKERQQEGFDNASRRGSSAGLGGPIPSRTMSENSRYVLGTDGRQVVETWEPDPRDAAGSRKSRLMPVDPRLDPFAPVYQRGENKSRESFNTIRDDHDYSRRVHQQAPILRATNPDD